MSSRREFAAKQHATAVAALQTPMVLNDDRLRQRIEHAARYWNRQHLHGCILEALDEMQLDQLSDKPARQVVDFIDAQQKQSQR
jgi:hypothetical protein